MKNDNPGKLPWISSGDSSIKAAIIDILDGEFWTSKISLLGNSLIIGAILGGTVELMMRNAVTGFWFYFSGLVFSIELFLRFLYAPLLYGGGKIQNPRIRYLTSFYGIIDVLSVLPFILHLARFNFSGWIEVSLIFRLWRIIRFFPAFQNIKSAFNSKKKEILISLAGITILSITLSALVFLAEKRTGRSDFKTMAEVFVWSLGKYTGDYGSIAQQVPLTIIGKILATVNGLLGIALFALPAGLLGSAFIDQMTEEKHRKMLNGRIKSIVKLFQQSVGGRSIFNDSRIKVRNFTFDQLQSRLILTENEMLDAIRESQNLRFRAMKSSPDAIYHDVKLVEYFESNRSYGYFNPAHCNRIWLINPLGAIEKGISHFTRSLHLLGETGFISREFMIFHNESELGGTFGRHYAEERATTDWGAVFDEFRKDLEQIAAEDIVVIIGSGASGRKDIVLEYGNPKGQSGITAGSTLKSEQLLNKVVNGLVSAIGRVEIVGGRATRHNFDFEVESHAIGNDKPEWLGQFIHRNTRASTITLHVNIGILTNGEERYYALLKGLSGFIESLKS